ncbi:uncharacterized protein RMCB_4968 [Mycolicibacterium brisbanense]|uniref:Uncharacterized protein n=1 Tax=Mycolicibacterium brisbanense TaxID=146020 RepID=A0A117I6Z2_9MYCO|nr:uncharacterized protein RMCB_4968 [Mycolicibacterium brisbanense]
MRCADPHRTPYCIRQRPGPGGPGCGAGGPGWHGCSGGHGAGAGPGAPGPGGGGGSALATPTPKPNAAKDKPAETASVPSRLRVTLFDNHLSLHHEMFVAAETLSTEVIRVLAKEYA